MKDKGIIPSDAKYVKVLARGIIDKPINIIANSFSLSAVKMIALTGGSAKRAPTTNKS
jgi:ribosomal protein L15